MWEPARFIVTSSASMPLIRSASSTAFLIASTARFSGDTRHPAGSYVQADRVLGALSHLPFAPLSEPVPQSLGRTGSSWSLSAVRFIPTRLSLGLLFRPVLPARTCRIPLVTLRLDGGLGGPNGRTAYGVSAITDGLGARHEPNNRSPALSYIYITNELTTRCLAVRVEDTQCIL